MYTIAHFAISITVGVALAVAVGAPPGRGAILVAYAAIVGTAIDLDHLVIARLRSGDWRHARFVITDPRAGLVDQDRIFEAGDVGPLTRLLSHALLGGSLVVGLTPVRPLLALVTAVVLYVHVVCDLVIDARAYEW